MNCSDVRVVIGAEPGATTAELDRHLGECAACADYRREMIRLDDNIRLALKLDLAALKSDGPARPRVRLVMGADAEATNEYRPPVSQSGTRQWALAASILLAVAVGFVLWGALPRHSLAADVVAHVISEPFSQDMDSTNARSTLARVLQQADLRLDPIHEEVTFAQTCFFRGRMVPHFVVRTDHGLVTVMILPNERVKTAERFAESGYTGVLLPVAGSGSVAVLSRTALDAEMPAREILSALHPRADG